MMLSSGKTTFARAVASRLAWPFVELFPSRLAAGQGGLPAGLSAAFGRLAELDRVLVFIDEVEEIAASREVSTTNIGVVNELLKALVAFRERPGRLLICATNSIRALDPAFLRHGRFDYVLPIGPPDEQARDAMWSRHVDIARELVDVNELVTASAGLTPADITQAARTVAQQMFEQALDTGQRQYPRTGDYVRAISALRPTLTPRDRPRIHRRHRGYVPRLTAPSIQVRKLLGSGWFRESCRTAARSAAPG